MIIECLGVSGVGKTTYLTQMQNQLKEKGQAYSWPRHRLYEENGWLARNMVKAFQVFSLAMRKGKWVRALRGVIASCPSLGLRERTTLLFNGMALQCLYEQCSQSKTVYLYDEGAFQYVWALSLRCGGRIEADLVMRCLRLFPAADEVYVLHAPARVIKERLDNRKNRKTYIESAADLVSKVEEMQEEAFRLIKEAQENGYEASFQWIDTGKD